MDLKELQKNWDEFGRTNPLWAILTDPTKRDEHWDLAEFFQTGIVEISETLDHLRSLNLHPGNQRALDFGCGVGRLTQALCGHFHECVGIDIAPSMISLAQEYNQYGDLCQYILNQSDDLTTFPPDHFDFIYTARVLQHMQPEYSTRYLREFLRVLAPGGVLVFQLPSEPVHLDQRLPRLAGTAAAPLPDRGFQAQIVLPQPPTFLPLAAQVILVAHVRNLSDVTWPAFASEEGRFQVQLGNHWFNERGSVVVQDDGRALLPRDVEPMGVVDLPIVVTTPSQPGKYSLELDMVQEQVAWFKDKGSQCEAVPIRIGGAVEGQQDAPESSLDSEQFHPRMEMHGVKREEVIDLLEHHGGRVVEVLRDHVAGDDWIEFRYVVKK